MPLLIGVVLLTVREPVNVESLQRAVLIWEIMRDRYKANMAIIRSEHKLTWFLRKDYWNNEKLFHSHFTGVIKRRIQLQTAIKEKENSNGR
jgi:hypothetical protein